YSILAIPILHSFPTRRSSDLYYFVVNDYMDFLVSGDWYSGRYLALRGQTHYRWLDRFVTGSFSFDWYNQLDVTSHSIREAARDRSEEHTSELQSRGHLVCRLL